MSACELVNAPRVVRARVARERVPSVITQRTSSLATFAISRA